MKIKTKNSKANSDTAKMDETLETSQLRKQEKVNSSRYFMRKHVALDMDSYSQYFKRGTARMSNGKCKL